MNEQRRIAEYLSKVQKSMPKELQKDFFKQVDKYPVVKQVINEAIERFPEKRRYYEELKQGTRAEAQKVVVDKKKATERDAYIQQKIQEGIRSGIIPKPQDVKDKFRE